MTANDTPNPLPQKSWPEGRAARSLKVTLRRSSHTVAVVLRTAAHPLRQGPRQTAGQLTAVPVALPPGSQALGPGLGPSGVSKCTRKCTKGRRARVDHRSQVPQCRIHVVDVSTHSLCQGPQCIHGVDVSTHSNARGLNAFMELTSVSPRGRSKGRRTSTCTASARGPQCIHGVDVSFVACSR
jgi:hypothetical protein